MNIFEIIIDYEDGGDETCFVVTQNIDIDLTWLNENFPINSHSEFKFRKINLDNLDIAHKFEVNCLIETLLNKNLQFICTEYSL